MLIALAGALTYVFVPQIVLSISEILKITDALSKVTGAFLETLPILEINKYLALAYIPPITIEGLSTLVVSSFISQIFIQYTLPLRSILWGMWYRELNGSLPAPEKKKSTRKVKRPSEKLMEESHKKYGTKKIDRNILRRAMEKDED